jgi:alkylation response protein AidB-like acyl-CoA dehydrogenase
MGADDGDAVAMARDLADGIASRAAEADREGRLPPEDVEALAESGYLGLAVPREYGGRGSSMREAVEAHLELSKASASTGLVAAMNLHLVGTEREYEVWSDEHRERLFRAAADGALLNSVASEPALGSPSHGQAYETTAEPLGDGRLRIDGHKTWITGGRHLSHLLVKLDLGGEPAGVLVEGDRDGLRWEETWGDALSLRASDSHDLHLDGVVVPEGNVLVRGDGPDTDRGWFLVLVAATYLGTALAARDALVEYANDRVPTALSEPIATLPKIRRQVGDLDTRLRAAEAFLLSAAADWPGDPERNRAYEPRIVAAKEFATTTAIEAAGEALRIAGGAGITPSLPFERYFRDVQAGPMHPPSGEEALEQVGRDALERRE